MNTGSWSPGQFRQIVARVVVEGVLELQSPAHFGAGDSGELTDMPLLVDGFDRKRPLLTGSSIAGALRSYLRTREVGYRKPTPRRSAGCMLFGGLKADEDGEQSPLIVDDALGKATGIDIREGVKIDPQSRTAAERKLYSAEVWRAGTVFPLRFELVIRERDNSDALKQALALALSGLADGEVTLGARKRRGYGRIKVDQWRAKTYDLTQPAGLADWILRGGDPLDGAQPQPDIYRALGVTPSDEDAREFFDITARFSLNGSLLIRAGMGRDDQGPDAVHLHARQRDGTLAPVLSGTSLGGALRARARKIANTLSRGATARDLVEGVFGTELGEGKQPEASRLDLRESVLQNAETGLVQNRVSIDRFTGGALEGALFNEQPAFGDNDTTVTVRMRLQDAKDYEIGVLLLLLKDLWTEDLPLGGEASIGRGRLRGLDADLVHRKDGRETRWGILAGKGGLEVSGADRGVLERCVGVLKAYLQGERDEA